LEDGYEWCKDKDLEDGSHGLHQALSYHLPCEQGEIHKTSVSITGDLVKL
jgi:hypothetical protein